MIIGPGKAWIGNIGEILFRVGGLSGASQYKWMSYVWGMSTSERSSVCVHESRGSGYWTNANYTDSLNINQLTGEWIYGTVTNVKYGTGAPGQMADIYGKYVVSMSPDYAKNYPFYVAPDAPYYEYDNKKTYIGPATVYSKVKTDIQYHYSTNRSAYPDNGNDGNRVYEFVGEITVANGAIFASGTCTMNDTLNIGFTPKVVIIMDTSSADTCISFQNMTMLLQNGNTCTKKSDAGIVTNGFKAGRSGSYVAIG